MYQGNKDVPSHEVFLNTPQFDDFRTPPSGSPLDDFYTPPSGPHTSPIPSEKKVAIVNKDLQGLQQRLALLEARKAQNDVYLKKLHEKRAQENAAQEIERNRLKAAAHVILPVTPIPHAINSQAQIFVNNFDREEEAVKQAQRIAKLRHTPEEYETLKQRKYLGGIHNALKIKNKTKHPRKYKKKMTKKRKNKKHKTVYKRRI